MSASEITSVNQNMMNTVATGDAAAVAAYYSEDGCLMAAGMDFLRGREAIQGFFQGAFDMGVKELKLVTIELEFFGDTATEIGTYELLAEGGAQADFGKFSVVWKNNDGQWQIHRDSLNTSLPAPE
jgi:uncharacterized protein (TIGR02246 family)